MTVTAVLGTETRDALAELAEAAGISRAALIREILEDFTETGTPCLKTI